MKYARRNDPILHLDNVIVTPHALCWTNQCFAGIGASDVQQILMFKKGEVPSHLVNRDVAETMRFIERLTENAGG